MSIREEFELDLSQAITTVADFGGVLDTVVDEFKKGLVEALEVFDTTAVVPVVADTSAIPSEVEDAVEGVSLEIPAVANVDGVVTAVAEVESSLSVAVPVVADTTEAEESIASIEAGDVSVNVSVETEGADEEIQSLTESAEGAVGAAGALAASLGPLSESATLTGKTVGGLVSAIDSIPVIGRATTAIAAIVGAATTFTTKALDSQEATDRFARAFGELGAQVEKIDIGDLNTSIGTLAKSLGSSGTEIKNNLASFAQLGEASGASAERIAESSEQVTVLAARAVALNPALGSVGQVIDSLSTGLARGGRFTTDYGISLTTAEIQTRAFTIAQERGSDQVNQFDRAAAGAALATEKYGASLNNIIATGANNPIIQLKALQNTLGATATELGRPLVAPLFSLLESAQPIFVNIITIVGQLATVVLPILTAAFQAVAPFISALTVELVKVTRTAGPGIIELITELARLTATTLSVVTVFLPVLTAFATGLGVLASVVSVVIGAFNALPGALQPVLGVLVLLHLAIIPAVSAAFTALYAVLLANPIFVIAAAAILAVGAIVTVFNHFRGTVEESTVATEEFRNKMFGAASTIGETRAKIEELDKSTSKYIATESLIAKSGQIAKLNELGITAVAVAAAFDKGAVGIAGLYSQLVAGGAVKFELDGIEQSAEQIKALGAGAENLVAQERLVAVQGKELVASLQNEAAARNLANKGQFDQLVFTGEITKARHDEIVAIVNSTGHTGGYAEALRLAVGAQKAAAIGTKALASGLASVSPAALKLEGELRGLADTTKAYDDSKKGVTDAERGQADAARGVEDAERGVAAAERGTIEASRSLESAVRSVEAARRGEVSAAQAVGEARKREVETLRAVNDATLAVIDAQNALNDALAGPSQDEQLGIDSARLGLRRAELSVLEQQAKAAEASGDTSRAAALRAQIESEQVLLDTQDSGIGVRRAQAEVARAEGAQQERAASAADTLATAQQRLNEARAAVAPAAQATIEAERGVEEAHLRVRDSLFAVETAEIRVADAERARGDSALALQDAKDRVVEADAALVGAHDAVTRAAIDLDTKQRSVNSAIKESGDSADEAIKHLEALQLKYPELAASFKTYIDELIRLKKIADGAGVPLTGWENKQDNSLDARASGGPVSAGKAYLVGERGPELFVPSFSGFIAPAAPLGDVVGLAGTVPAAGTTVGQVVVNVTVPGDVPNARAAEIGRLAGAAAATEIRTIVMAS